MSAEADSREEVQGALEPTLSRGAARIAFRYQFSFDFDMPQSRSSPRRDEPLIRRFGKELCRQSLRLVLRGGLRLTRRWMRKVSAQRAVGVVDFAAHRCMYHQAVVSFVE